MFGFLDSFFAGAARLVAAIVLGVGLFVATLGSLIAAAYWLEKGDYMAFFLSIFIPFYGPVTMAMDLLE